MAGREIFEVSDFSLLAGETLPTARLAYRTLGTLSPARDNVVVIPSWYSGTHREAERCMVGGRRTHQACGGLVDGRLPGLSMGRAVPGHGQGHRRALLLFLLSLRKLPMTYLSIIVFSRDHNP